MNWWILVAAFVFLMIAYVMYRWDQVERNRRRNQFYNKYFGELEEGEYNDYKYEGRHRKGDVDE